MDLAHVLWIGGAQGSGKSSVARALAHRFDLQLYNVDRRTWVHEPRMPRTEFQTLSLEERWVEPAPARMLDWFTKTSRHRFRLVLEDLRELPDAPGAVVEGPQLFPTSVAAVLRSPDQALFLLPDPEEQRARLVARGPMLNVSDGAVARAKATERDLMISMQYERDLAAVRRFENDVTATQVRLYVESLLPTVLDDEALAFSCECGEAGCSREVALTLAEYEAVSASGDRSPLRRPTP